MGNVDTTLNEGSADPDASMPRLLTFFKKNGIMIWQYYSLMEVLEEARKRRSYNEK